MGKYIDYKDSDITKEEFSNDSLELLEFADRSSLFKILIAQLLESYEHHKSLRESLKEAIREAIQVEVLPYIQGFIDQAIQKVQGGHDDSLMQELRLAVPRSKATSCMLGSGVCPFCAEGKYETVSSSRGKQKGKRFRELRCKSCGQKWYAGDLFFFD